jgi:hypothetical protein
MATSRTRTGRVRALVSAGDVASAARLTACLPAAAAVYTPPILKRLEAALPGTNLTAVDLNKYVSFRSRRRHILRLIDALPPRSIMSVCGFESVRSLEWKESKWCSVFKPDEWQQVRWLGSAAQACAVCSSTV